MSDKTQTNRILTTLPETEFLRLKQIVGDKKATPPIPALIPVCPATWWNGVKNGRFPKPVKLGANSTGWRVEDVRSLIDTLAQAAG
ncbi:helix-turn-helix transcriptional regulator [Candidatus Magnetaquicoccus inordinatus]|uniref:helix-turn-helix transcriptional regulator n=1 Tax=Candidatus Magnetaquicoccus inordinatus TaxID=2496818 RepID=UPI001D0F0282|nr:AlpA family phage regulatory protein [Candidatus Magnetaquicoccus inordinatus]